jgi:hypothetical protein
MHYEHAPPSSYMPGVPKTGMYLGDARHTIRSVFDSDGTYCEQPWTPPDGLTLLTLESADACVHWNDQAPDPGDVRPGGDVDLKAAFRELQTPEGAPLNSPEDYNGQTAPGVIHSAAPPWPGTAEMERRVEAELASGHDLDLVQLLDSLLGGESTDPLDPLAIPFPRFIEKFGNHGDKFQPPFTDPLELDRRPGRSSSAATHKTQPWNIANVNATGRRSTGMTTRVR